MTENPFIPPTHPSANLVPVTAPAPAPAPASPVPNGNQPRHEDEEEPYTIKCICVFEDDDGSTVFCERCETWQHIVCYYGGEEKVPDIHNCADCEPRPLDAKRATERQRQLREQSEAGDRKPRRPASKGQRKKAKDAAAPTTEQQPDGAASQNKPAAAASATGAANSSHKDLLQSPKKPRHRASASTSSLTGGASEGRKRRSSTATPSGATSKTSLASHHPPIPLYSPEFIHLYDRDQVNVDMHGNLFDTIGLAGDLASWVQDPSTLAQVTNGRNSKDVFTHSDELLDSSKWPTLTKQSTTDTSIAYDGSHPTWKFLRVEQRVQKDQVVGEVRGKVGHFRDYCLDPNSRWQELRHPEPFVFFHPQLPIYIDSRQEGTQLRYIRRSCRPNVTMKTFITNQVEYHFCFVANQDIPENTEITTTWYLDPQMFPSNSELVKQDGSNDGIPDSAAICISNVLAHFGGCACDSSQPCLLAKLDLRRPPKPSDSNAKQTNGKRKRNKTKSNTSPASTGPATNSRAGSETAKHQDDEDRGDTRSTSGSTTRDQPQSRDLSPTGPSAAGVAELSAREKRKLAAVEKKFEQLERDQQQPPQKRKKRNTSSQSQPSNSNPLKSISSTSGPFSNAPRLDTAVARQPSNSPTKDSPTKMSPQPTLPSRQRSNASPRKTSGSITPRGGSPLVRRAYVDSAMQTEPDENDPLYTPPKPVRRHGFVSLTQRLLKRSYEDRLKLGDAGRLDDKLNRQMILDAPVGLASAAPPSEKPGLTHAGEDIEMKDADTAVTPTKPKLPFLHTSSSTSSDGNNLSSSTASATGSLSLFSLPSTAAHCIPALRIPPGALRLQPPSQPPLSSSSVPTSTTKMSPPSAFPSHAGAKPPIPPMPDSASSVSAPSPVKKKLTLNDYMNRRESLKTPTTEKAQPPAFPVSQTPAGSADGSSPPLSQPGKSEESIKQESPVTPNGVMKDVHMSPNDTENSSSSLQRDPRLQSRT